MNIQSANVDKKAEQPDSSLAHESQLYCDHRKYLIEATDKQATAIDRTVMTLASGGLGLAAAYVQTGLGQSQASLRLVLAAAIVFLWMAIVATLASMALSRKCFHRHRQILDTVASEGVTDITRVAWIRVSGCPLIKWTNRVGALGLMCFGLGTAALATYGIIPLCRNGATSDGTQSQSISAPESTSRADHRVPNTGTPAGEHSSNNEP